MIFSLKELAMFKSRLLLVMCGLAILVNSDCLADGSPKVSLYDKMLPQRDIFEICGGHDGPVIKKGDPGTEDNKYGFEGGRALK